MADLTRADVEHLAALARIDLSDAELDRMVGELGVILESVATVQQAPIDDVEPMSHPMPLVNVTRPDLLRPSLTPQEALSGPRRSTSSASPSRRSSTRTDALVCREPAAHRCPPDPATTNPRTAPT